MALDAPHTDNDGEPSVKFNLLQAFWRELQRVWKKEALEGPRPQTTDEEFKKQIGPVKPGLHLLNAPSSDALGRFYQGYFSPGAICTVAALYFTKGCADVEEVQNDRRIKKPVDFRHFFYVLITDPETRETRGFNDRPGYFFDLLPPRLKKDLNGNDLDAKDPPSLPDLISKKRGSSFMLSYPSKDDAENRKWLTAQMANAIENFKAFVNEEPAN